MKAAKNTLTQSLNNTFEVIDEVVNSKRAQLKTEEVGTVNHVQSGIVHVRGLEGVKLDEVLLFEGDLAGMAFNVDVDEVGVVMLDESEQLNAGSEVRRTRQVVDVPVGEELIGRVIDPRGKPFDGKSPPEGKERRPVERPAWAIMDRAPVTVPLQTGLKVVDAMIPIGRGQRELILGDRQTGKTAIAVDTIINQKESDVICIYCGIGKRVSAVAKVINTLNQYDAMEYSIVIIATEEDPPGLQFIAPYAAASLAEYFMENGKDTLVIFDDLTRHARAYRELSLLLRRPPGREAYPGDIFYIHSRLLERSTHLRDDKGGGSLTALPIVETEAQNISAYIPTNLISITDGQIYLSPDLFGKGILPAVDVGESVSRVGGKTQLPAYREVAADLRLSYSQFEELESFARFGTRLDEETKKKLERGKRVREVLKQSQYIPIPSPEQIAVLLAVNEGILDALPLEKIAEAEKRIRKEVTDKLPDICDKIEAGKKLEKEDLRNLKKAADSSIEELKEKDKQKEEMP